jgi:hypothetical protein
MPAREPDQKSTATNALFDPSTKGAPGTASVVAYLCEECGPDKPAKEVWICTLCIKPYCVQHLTPLAHMCFGALGKPQKEAGVSRV